MIVSFGISPQELFGQLLLGLINGSFYAMLSLGLAIIFGLLNIINFTHGALYMLGAFIAWMLLEFLGVGYWLAIIIVPIIVGAIGILIERFLLSPLYKFDHLYSLLLTFGLALIIQGVFRNKYGSSGLPYSIPTALTGAKNLGFMILPNYRGWVVGASATICLTTWLVIERTRLGSYLRAATENPALTRAFGINVPRLITVTFGVGVALAALAGVMAAPIYSVNPNMGSDLLIVVFAVVVIGGMGSILGSIVTGFGLGLIEGLTKVFYPEASTTVIFVVMVLVLMVKPAGIFGVNKSQSSASTSSISPNRITDLRTEHFNRLTFTALPFFLIAAPFIFYPVFLMKVLCFALFALAFNLLLGYGGLLSFGHAAYFGMAGYVTAFAAKGWHLGPELSLLLGTAVAMGLGLIFGAIAIRRQGIYFAMITLALAQMIYFFSLQAPRFTGGEDGIQDVPRGKLLGFIGLADDISLYFVIATLFFAGSLLIFRIINSPFGEVLKAIRENEARAISLGYRTSQYKLVLFVLSATLAGLAGAMKTFVFQLASLVDVHWSMSGEAILMTLVGGLGTVFGPVVGAFLIVAMDSYLSPLGAWVSVAQGVIFVVCVLFFREGAVGLIERIFKSKLLTAWAACKLASSPSR